MKKLVLLALIGVTIISCKKEEPVKDYLILSGKIDNYKKSNLTLNGFNFEKKINFDKSTSSFTDTLRIERDGYYTLIFNKKPVNVYLTKTDDTGMVFDFKNLKIINFEGANKEINNYLLEKQKIWPEILVSANKYFALEEEEFLNKTEEYKEAVTELSISKQLPAEFITQEVKNIDYECLRNIYNYQDYHATLTGNKDFKVSEDFPDPLENFNYSSDSDYVNSYFYRAMLEAELKRIATLNNKEGEDYYLTYLETVQTEVTDTIAKNDLLYSSAQNSITYASDLKEFYKKFMAYSTNETHKKEITKDYNLLKTTAKGQPAPKFKDYVNYDGGTTSMDDLLKDGKYLYIDVWATWCGYCKREIPLLKMLEQEYHGKNIEFVSINVDDKGKEEKWKETIQDREMTGIQLMAGDSHLNLEWAQNFLIKGLPRFIIIDPEGKIVSPNAPAPSQGEKLINLFNELGI
ncbi:TlpA disulfide reductase family protein [Tenacibaculum tangerinum]|uniref:TlpA disulfide reductase family protein n=1 Tax=Tenacibaculum tangerinum TaxID=3038772 RepID=A0ABY8L694_9FLAO|nr:TlpA disulfide reductase family protein [Tenacibaculum tangerinum]WGH76917.1 TlpA disulfide reductase family protein [Tenacibaculum tangerinum]